MRCSGHRMPALPQELRQVVAHQFLKLRFALIRPPQALFGEALLEVQYLAPLVCLRSGLGHRGSLVEIDHDLWTAVLLPRGVGPQEFVFSTRAGIIRWRAKTLPEDAEEHVALLDAQDGIDQPLRSFGVKT